MSIGEIISAIPWNKKMEVLRTAKEWNQENAAEQCGTTKKNYWLWESGKSYPRFNSRKAIASAFGVPVNEIFPVISEKEAM